MIVDFDQSFLKSIKKIKDKKALQKVREIIITLEESDHLNEIKNLKKLKGFQHYYRIRIGDYRLGLEEIEANKVCLIILAHRKDIYKKFP